ncbi:hypothetical protein D3C77_463840 [compost metagenome]
MYVYLSLIHEPSSDADVINDRAQRVFKKAYGQAAKLIEDFYPKIETMAELLMRDRGNSASVVFTCQEVAEAEERAMLALPKLENQPLEAESEASQT